MLVSKKLAIACVALGVVLVVTLAALFPTVVRTAICDAQKSSMSTTTTTTTSTTTTSQSSTSTTTLLTTTTLPASTITTTPSTITTATTTTTTTTTTTPLTTTFDESSLVRLPDYLKPINYDVLIRTYFKPRVNLTDINVDAENEYYLGQVTIEFRLTKATDRVLLHMDERLNLTSGVTIMSQETGHLFTVSGGERKDFQLYEVQVAELLEVGTYTITLEFRAFYSWSGFGFFSAKYQEDGFVKTVLYTQFSPIHARTAYPCFDEPALKATFDITVEHPVNTIALSTFPLTDNLTESFIENGQERLRSRFDRTYLTSTYLSSFAVIPADDFSYKQVLTNNGVPLRIYARNDVVSRGLVDFGLDAFKKVIDFYENDYFENSDAIPPKIDMLLPTSSVYNGMENWGLIICRESTIVYSEANDTLALKNNVLYLIAHEVAHFWFGDLLTVPWWDDVWLKEGPSTFFAAKATQKLYPELDSMNYDVTDLIDRMYSDSFNNTRSLSIRVVRPNETNIFDRVVYSKGNMILRMIESTVTEEIFRNDIKRYINENKFGVISNSLLYNSFTWPAEMNGVTGQQYVEGWLYQKHFPLVYVALDNNVNGLNGSQVRFSQERFRESVNHPDASLDNDVKLTWGIFLRCKAGGTFTGTASSSDDIMGNVVEFSYYLNDERGSHNFTNGRKFTWIHCNKDFKGYYLNDYSEEVFNSLTNVLKMQPQYFSIGERANLVHLSYILAYIGSHSYSLPALFSPYLEAAETDYVPWWTFIWNMNRLAQVLEHRPAFKPLSAFAISLVKANIEVHNVTLLDDQGTYLERLLKASMLGFLCRMQDEESLLNATDLFKTLPLDYFVNPVQTPNVISVNQRSSVYNYHMQNTYEFYDWFDMRQLYVAARSNISGTLGAESDRALASLAFSRSRWLLSTLTTDILDNNIGGPFTILNSLATNPSGRALAWLFMRHHWYTLVEKFGLTSSLSVVVRNIAQSFDNELQFETLMDFFKITDPGRDGAGIRDQTYEIVKHNLYWVKSKESEIIDNLFGPLLKKQETIFLKKERLLK